MKVLFLDIDGVLNAVPCRAPMYRIDGSIEPQYSGINIGLTNILNGLLEVVDCNIVISSSWRINPGMPVLLVNLEKAGFKFNHKIIGHTPNLQGMLLPDGKKRAVRGHEIQAFIDEWNSSHDNKIDKFAIVDDDSDMAHLLPYLSRTKYKHGIRPKNVTRLKELLHEDQVRVERI